MEQDKVEAFLSQFPPDWEKAEEHGLANLCVDPSKTELDLQNAESYCVCCHMPNPKDDQWFEICCDNMDLGAMGPGFPLYFELIKKIGFLMLFLTIIYFLPAAYMMYDAYNDLKGNLKPGDSIIGLFSFGAFVQYLGEEGYEFLDHGKRKTYIGAVISLMAASVFLSLIYLVWMRSSLQKQALELDIQAKTPSDFCIMGMNMKFNSYGPDDIEKEIRESFQRRYGIEVEYVNPAFSIDEFYKLFEKQNQLMKQKMQVDAYCEKEKINLDKYKTYIKEGNTPDDFPKVPKLCGGPAINPDEVDAELQKVQDEIKVLEDRAKDEGSKEDQEESFTGIVFVVLKTPRDCLKVLDNQDGIISGKIKRFFFGCCMENESQWLFERAPEPSDIFWENLSTSTFTRLCGGLFSYIATTLMVLGSFGIIYLIKVAQIDYMEQ